MHSDRPTPPTKPIAYSPTNSDRPSSPIKPDRLLPHIKQRSPPQHPQNLIAYSLQSNSDRHLSPTNQIAYQSIKITRLSVVNFDYWQ
ncbi:hypothetical protein VB774_24055 [Pseudanabaena galeata UHCC 0370]|uniref:Uncharacterized protein n=1 Tax=Pseudanabaena galeata UHCC 0370 TaxID=3110310 RepID=A0ABU5TRF5_9CYAN|nr:hypothetical protein [Pseudanabaena galeata]MEA5480720.1 hypothetical protein [Pseudanabaena galeata UHCC 0370]